MKSDFDVLPVQLTRLQVRKIAREYDQRIKAVQRMRKGSPAGRAMLAAELETLRAPFAAALEAEAGE